MKKQIKGLNTMKKIIAPLTAFALIMKFFPMCNKNLGAKVVSDIVKLYEAPSVTSNV